MAVFTPVDCFLLGSVHFYKAAFESMPKCFFFFLSWLHKFIVNVHIFTSSSQQFKMNC